MALKLQSGDYVPDGVGGLIRAGGREALLQRALFRLTARRGTFPFLPELGSRLGQLGAVPPAQRQAAAAQYAAEALEQEALAVESVELTAGAEGAMDLTVHCLWQGESLPVTVEII
nr:hypothetical protein [uncultured Oscillibacter sp.]